MNRYLALGLALLLWFLPSGWTVRQNPVKVESGLLTGVSSSDGAVRMYRGIPFAAPPVGSLRWRAPERPGHWEGVRRADTFSPGCIQTTGRITLPWTAEFMHPGTVSEDCLYLNIWAGEGRNRPVLVYFHGGAFKEGSGSIAVYDGEALARKGLVVVTVNYRLGALGFLAHPELTKESGRNASGNYGLMDQVAALRWIRDNIAAFGGDPGRVTISGQSAGAMSVYLLTTSPLAKGLFHRAIMQSGPGGLASFGVTGTGNMARPLEQAEADGARYAAARGATSLAALRALPADSLLPSIRFGPVADGYVVAGDRPAMADVPLLTGMNADEPSAFPGYGSATLESFRTDTAQRFGNRATKFLELYPATSDREAGDMQKVSSRDLGLVALGRLAAQRAAGAGSPAYLYLFERAIPWPEHPEFGAFHTGEVPYVFGTLDRVDRPWQPVDRRLAETTMTYWANFAATGNPNGSGVPQWPRFDPERHTFMVLGEATTPHSIPDESRRAFFDAVLADTPGR